MLSRRGRVRPRWHSYLIVIAGGHYEPRRPQSASHDKVDGPGLRGTIPVTYHQIEDSLTGRSFPRPFSRAEAASGQS